MTLTREQIAELHGDSAHEDCWMCDLRDTALAYHGLRDIVLTLCDLADPPGLRAGLPTVTVAALRSAILALDEEEKS